MTFNQFISLTSLFTLGCTSGFSQSGEYWQQKVDTRIEVTLDDSSHMLRGKITIDYFNNSPDTLPFLYLHLYPNAYQNDRTAYALQAVENRQTAHYFSKEQNRGFIDSLQFTVLRHPPLSGELFPEEQRYGAEPIAGLLETEHIDIVKVALKAPLLPHQSISLSTPFRVKIPETFSRLGHKGQSYQISQWFPKPAVYDRQGWHPMPYLDQGEFYSEYGSYEVYITLPRNYIVMGTGNIRETTEQRWMDSLSRLELPSDTLYMRYTPPSSTETKTISFHEENIHDFAWFADKRWVLRQDTATIPETGSVVTASVAYYPWHQKGWANSISSLKTTLTGYSKRVGPYPYSTIKAVEGSLRAGGGMEYPTVTIIAASNDPALVHQVLIHEAGHNWFYGILGSNERRYPWMDEGINSFYEQKLVKDTGKLNQVLGGRDENYMAYALLSATHDLVAADRESTLFPYINYGIDIYGKSAYFLGWLEAYMGPDRFEQAMQEYFTTWKFRHPQPEDFEAIFRKHSDRNLDWFFQEALTSNKSVDFALKSVRKQDHYAITVKNKTGLKAPALLVLEQDGKEIASAWTEPFLGKTVVELPLKDSGNTIKIASVIPDYNIRNNFNQKGLRFRPLLGLNRNGKQTTWIAPAIGYNIYDGFMAGLLFHNLTIPQNKFQFALAPLYSLGSNTLTGTGKIGYTFYRDNGWLHDLQLDLEGKTFSYQKSNLNLPEYLHNRFIKLAPELTLNLRKPYPRSTVQRSLSLKSYWIREESFDYQMNPVDSQYRPEKGPYQDNFYGKVTYRHQNRKTFNPFGYTVEGQIGQQFAKLSLEAHLKIDYFLKGKAFYIRGYAGKFFAISPDYFDTYRYQLSQTYSGRNDYLYDETFLGRNAQTGLGAQQISIKEGGFKVNTLQYANQIGLSSDWLFALNLKSDLPLGKLPLRIYADIGTFTGARQENPSGAGILYAAGLELYLGNYCSLFVPIIMSKDYKEYNHSMYPKDRFLKTLSFSINLSAVNWFKLPQQLLQIR